jgi:putative hydrolase of the HAD superfamily
MIHAVLFDLDGTLLDRESSIRRFISEQYERFSSHLSQIQKDAYTTRFLALENKGYVWKDRVYEQLITDFSISTLTPEVLLEDYIQNFKHYASLFPYTKKMLQILNDNNIKLAIITNGFETFQMANIYKLDIQRFFSAILISEKEGIKKPNPIIFARALQRLNVVPEGSLFVGDHPFYDIEGAKQAGMKTAWKQSNEHKQADADFTFHDFPDLLDFVLRQNKR